MNYTDTLNYLYNAAPMFQNIGAGAYKAGLSTSHALDAHFGHPHRSFRSVHVAGTNREGLYLAHVGGFTFKPWVIA